MHRFLMTPRQRRQRILLDIAIVVVLATLLIGLYTYSAAH